MGVKVGSFDDLTVNRRYRENFFAIKDFRKSELHHEDQREKPNNICENQPELWTSVYIRLAKTLIFTDSLLKSNCSETYKNEKFLNEILSINTSLVFYSINLNF